MRIREREQEYVVYRRFNTIEMSKTRENQKQVEESVIYKRFNTIRTKSKRKSDSKNRNKQFINVLILQEQKKTNEDQRARTRINS